MAMGSAFNAEELELMRPVRYAEHWYTKQQQVIKAAHKNCEKRVAAEKALEDERDEKLALQKELADLKRSQASATITTRIPPWSKESDIVSQLRAQVIKLTSEKIELQKALDSKDGPEASEDEYVQRKLAELSVCKKNLQKMTLERDKLANNLAEYEQKLQIVSDENTASKHSLTEQITTLIKENSALKSENLDLQQQASEKKVVDIGSLQAFPILTSSGKKTTDSRSSITLTSDMSSSIASDMIARFERLETKILQAVSARAEAESRPVSPITHVEETDEADVEIVNTRTVEERNAEGFAKAIDLDVANNDDDDSDRPWLTHGKKKPKKKQPQ